MSKRAWIYIGGVLLTAVLMSAAALPELPRALHAWPTFGMLVVLATLSQLFYTGGPGNVAFFATPVFLFAGVLLLDPSLFVLLAIIPRLTEWLKQRWVNRSSPHLGAWYIQPFNIANDLINGLVAGWVFRVLSEANGSPSNPAMLFAATSAVIAFVVLNHLMLGQGLVLARKITWRETGLLSPDSVISDLILLCLGACVAMLWLFNPWFLPLAVSPLGMMYRALMIPQLKHEAETDPKTGLLNARHFNRKFSEELDRAARFGRPMAVIMSDLDYLRNINNTYGHLAGDTVIIGIAEIIRKTIREYDLAGRFGGEEFCIVLLEVTPIEAYALADRIRRAIETASFEIGASPTPIRATMSLGVACFPVDGTTVTGLTHEADVAVYQAKLQGRNRVVCAADVPQSIKAEHAATGSISVQPKPDRQANDDPAATPPASDAASPIEQRAPAAQSAPQPRTPTVSPVDERTRATGETSAPVAGRAAPSAITDEAPAPPVALRLLVGAVILAGLVITVVGSSFGPRIDPASLAVLAILIVLTEYLQVNVYGRSAMSASLAPIFASALIGGVPMMSLISALSAGVDHWRQRRSPKQAYKTAFNWATHIIAGGLTALPVSMQLLPGALPGFLPLAILTLAGTLAYFLLETGLISAAIAVSQRVSIGAIWRAQFRWLATHFLVLGMLGLFLSIAYGALGVIGIIVFALPVLMMRYVQQQYIERTEDSVRELQRMNRELAQANQEIMGGNRANQELNARLQDLNDELFRTLGKILDARDPYVGGHAAQMAHYAVAIARELGLPAERAELVRQAGFLHDIGKIAIPEQILHKPAKLTDAEYAVIKTHAAIGAELLQSSKGLHQFAPFVRHHHERWDGRGYPDGLNGEEIPLEARILNVCDSVEAMASDRPYKQGMPLPEIIAEVKRCAGSQFDPAVADAFIRLAEQQGADLVLNSAHEVARKHGDKQPLTPAGHTWPLARMKTAI